MDLSILYLPFLMEEIEAEELLLFSFEHEEDEMQLPKSSVIFNLDLYTESEAKAYFRFSKIDIVRLQFLMRIPKKFKGKYGTTVNGLEALCILLRRLAYPNRYVDLMKMFPYSKSEFSCIVNSLVALIYNSHHHKLESFNQPLLNPENIKKYALAITNKGSPLNRCWGFLDGTVRPICRPTSNQQEYFNGHKRVHAEKFQSLMLPNGIIANMFGPMPGRRHDAALLAESGLLIKCAQSMTIDGQPYYLYGDPAYPLRKHLMVGYKGTRLTVDQQNFNSSMSRLREVVEWGFAKIIGNFAFLDYKKNLKVGLQAVGKYFMIAVLLSNCHSCVYGSQVSDYFNCFPPSLEEYLS